jgi:hypothetical protein
MAILKKDDILNAQDSKTVTLEVPEWGGEVIIATMSGFARDRFEASIMGKNGGMNMLNVRAKMVAACLVDEEGNLLFSENDILRLGKKSCAALDRIFEEAQKLNRLGDQDIENLAKN